MANAANSKNSKHSGGGSSSSRHPSSRHQRRVVRVNRRLVLVTAGVGVLLAAGAYVVHGFQMERHADTFLARADAAEKDGEIDQAIGYLAHYYQFRPNDTDALLRLGRLRQEIAADYRQWRGVFFTFEEVLRRNPSHPEAAKIRRDLVDVAMKIGEFDEARVHLERLLKDKADDAELLYLLGRCWHAERRFEKAVRLYLQAIDGAPSVTEHYLPLAGLLAREFESLPRREELEDLKVSAPTKALIPPREEINDTSAANAAADLVLARMVEQCRPPHEAYLARAQYRQGRERLAEAREDIEAARASVPDSPDLLLQSASLALAESDDARVKGDREKRDQHLATARADAEAGLAQDQDDLRFYLILAQLERQAAAGEEDPSNQLDRLIAAEDYLEQGLARVPALREAREQSAAELTNLWIRLNWSLADVMLTRAELARTGDGQQDGVKDPKDPKDPKRHQEPDAIFKNVAARIGELDDGGASRALVDFLNARMHMVKREWPVASRLLEQSRRQLPSDSEDIQRIDLMLGMCYAAMGNPDQQIDVYRRALNSNPRWLPGRLGLAAAYVKANRLDDGLREYNLVSNVPGVPAEVARILLMKELAKPADRRRWDHIPQVLDVAEKVSPDSVDVLILRAQVQSLQGHIDEAVTLLDSAREAHADAPEFWAARANLELQRTDREPLARFRESERLLVEAKDKLGAHVALRLAAANAILMLPPEDAQRELAQLEKDVDQFTRDEQATLFEGLAAAYVRAGDRDKAESLWQQVAALRPAELAPQLVLAEFAAREQDKQALRAILGRIRKIEGTDGPTGNYIEALIVQDEIFKNEELRGKPEKLDEALQRPRRLLQKAMNERPYWSGPPRALGGLEWEYVRAAVASRTAGDEPQEVDDTGALLTSRQEKAIEYYEIAFEHHDRSRSTIERLVRYYSAKGQYGRADELLRQIEKDAPALLSGELVRLAAGVAWQRGNLDESVQLATDLASESKDASDQILLARLQFARGERGESVEGPLQEACRLAPEKAETWLALIEYYVRTDDKPTAQTALQDAEQKLNAEPAYYRPLALARFHELLGERDQAEARYTEALQAAQSDQELDKSRRAAVVDGLRAAMVEFYIRGRDTKLLTKADRILGDMLAPGADTSDEARDWARRRQALVVASTGTYEASTKALDLLLQRGSGETEKLSAADLRVKAAILARRSTRSDRQELIETLEALAQRKVIRPQEEQQLAHLYEAEQRWTEALETYRKLVDANPTSAPFLADYAFALLNRAEKDDSLLVKAEEIVGKLEALEPTSFRAATTRATLLYRQGDAAAAVPILKGFLERLDSVPPEQTFRDLLEQKKLDETLDVLTDLARQRNDAAARKVAEHVRKLLADGDQEEALAVLTRYVQASDMVVAVQAELVRIVAGLMEQIGQHAAAEETLRDYANRSPRPEAELTLAAFLTRRDRLDEALAVCKEARKTADVSAVATMSVAILRAGQPTPQQIETVERWLQDAIAKAEPEQWHGLATRLADLYDLLGRYDEAALIYQEMLMRNSRDVVALNNLAWLLAFQPSQRTEALHYIDRAIDLAGPIAALLDTRGVVYLQMDRPREALTDLNRAVQEQPAATFHFHLALVHLRTGNQAAALQSFHQAENGGLTREDVHPLEQADYNRLTDLAK